MAINIDGDAPPNSSRTSEENPECGGSTASSIFVPQTAAEIAERQRIGEEMWELRQTIRFVSREIFGTNNLRTYQMKALVGCLNPIYCESKMLFVTRTGYGKSHVMRTLGVVLGGVVVIFVPLLSLSADQMNKMKEANQNYGTVETHHLDEFPTDDGDQTLDNLVNRIAQLQDDTTSTIFLFTSPQFLCQQSNKPLLDELISAHKRGVLRVVGIDEAHLFVQHSSFRVEIHMLTELFFKKVFDKERPKSHPVLLAMTATMPDRFVPKLEALIATRPPMVRPPELDHFEQRHIKMEFGVNCVSFVPELDRLVGVITDSIIGEEHDASERVVGLTTLASTAIALDEKLCEKLNKKKCDVDVVVVHGQLHKLDKFYNMRLFCAKLEYEHFRPRALVTNGAGNTGIDF
mmetsp:Transcript_15996/g.27214  ORF Transcript_15996/g.27214 Transcript_15996/m.27214 type:complete len:404 (-) Transcript_15996:1753-2964(-)